MQGVVIDRSRVSHGEQRRMAAVGVRLTNAERSGDADGVERLWEEVDALYERMIVKVPDDIWVEDAPASAKALEPGWLGYVRSDKYTELMQEIKAPPGAEGN